MNMRPELSHLLTESRLSLGTPLSIRHLLLIKDIQNALLASDWREAAFFASTCRGAGHVTCQQLIMEAADAPEALRQQMMTDTVQAAAAKLGAPSDRMKIFQRLMDEVKTQAVDVQQRWSGPLTALASDDMAPLMALFAAPESPFDPLMAYGIAATVSLLTFGLHAGIHAEFNLVFHRQHPDLQDPFSWCNPDAIDDAVSQFGQTLDTHLETIFHALKESHPSTRSTATRPLLNSLVNTIELDLLGFVRKQAVACATASLLLGSDHAAEATRLGEALCRAGRLTREALASYAVAHFLEIGLTLPQLPERLQPVVRIPETMVFDCAGPSRTLVPLNDLAAVQEGMSIEIAGVVTKIETIRDATHHKLVSVISLLDPLTGTAGSAIGVYLHAPHRGIAVDAWVQLAGTFRASSSFLDGAPAVEIDHAVAPGTIPRSWRTGFLQSASNWIQVWPNHLDICWSLSPHTPTSRSDMLHLGAGELIYRKPLPGSRSIEV